METDGNNLPTPTEEKQTEINHPIVPERAITVPVSFVEDAKKERGEEFYNELMDLGNVIGDRFCISYQNFENIYKKHGVVFKLPIDIILLESKKEQEQEEKINNELKKVISEEELDVYKKVRNLASQAYTFVSAMSESAKTGFKTVENFELKKRKSICSQCSYWDPNGFWGSGKCNACGCSGAKLWLATSSCPLKKWDRVI